MFCCSFEHFGRNFEMLGFWSQPQRILIFRPNELAHDCMQQIHFESTNIPYELWIATFSPTDARLPHGGTQPL